jgi:hypothetical protein
VAATPRGPAKCLLSQQRGHLHRSPWAPLFQYSWTDDLADWWSSNRLGTRTVGAGQMALGGLGVAASRAACVTGWGCAVGLWTGTQSADFAQVGARTWSSGHLVSPYGEQVLQFLGMSPEAASWVYGLAGLTPVALEGWLANRAVRAWSQGNVAVRATYAGPGLVDDALAPPVSFSGGAGAADDGLALGNPAGGLLNPAPRSFGEGVHLNGGAAQQLGLTREQQVASTVGGQRSGEIIRTSRGSTDVDVIDPMGNLIAVGGPAKERNLGGFVQSLMVYSEVASQRGVNAYFYYAPGTPQSVIDKAIKVLGGNFVRPIR